VYNGPDQRNIARGISMSRPLSAVIVVLVVAGAASAQCHPWYPVYPVVPQGYPLSPAIWGAPAPKPLPPVPPPYTPKPKLTDEDVPVPTKSKEKSPAKEPGGSSDGVRIPKTKLPLPGDRIDKAVPEPPKSDGPKKDRAEGKSFEQYVVPAEGRGEPRAEVKVGFFNHSDREIALTVNGEAVRLPAEQYVTLRLPRTFTWSEKGTKGNEVVVPPDAEGIEIVFRK
jgi:hypothetical protein